jgi:hypothetical protein
MNTTSRKFFALLGVGLAFTGALAAAGADASAGRVSVRFHEPEKFTDLKERATDHENEEGREHFLPLFEKHLQNRAPAFLADGQQLAVTFTNIDLAGDFEPGRGPVHSDVRIVRDRYVPRLEFAFKLTDASGTVVKEGARKLLDGSFLIRGAGMDTDSLRYEKTMLDDWMRKEFRPRRE